jgi:UDP-glucose 4-epimerase
MTILVTGGAGYIGSHMLHALADVGERVVVLDNLTTGFDWAVAPGASLWRSIARRQTDRRAPGRRHHPFCRLDRRAGLGSRSARLLPQQYGELARADRAAVKGGVRHVIFSSSAAVYGNPERVPAREDDPTLPCRRRLTAPRKLMTEIMLRDAGAVHGLRHDLAGADPLGRTGHSTMGGTHLIKVAVETALGSRPKLDVFGTDYPMSDGSCIRDYIHVSDLVATHCDALAYLRAGGASATLNCGYGRGFSVLEVIDTVKRVSGVDFKVEFTGRRAGDPAHIVGIRSTLKWQPRLHDLDTIVGHALAWERKLSKRTI